MWNGTRTRPPRGLSLSAKLLLLTIFFVMVSEVLIFAPSIARFRKVYLEERITMAHLATLTLGEVPDLPLDRDVENTVLQAVGVHGIVLQGAGRRMLVVSAEMPPAVDRTYDVGGGNSVMWIVEAFEALAQDRNRVLRVIGAVPGAPEARLEVVMDETPMRVAMYGYATRILQLSVVISLLTAALVYVSLRWIIVRPVRRITASMGEFRADPENVRRPLPEGRRADEMGLVARELGVMQQEVRAALRQKTRLATLGAAVAKVNHDLRNTLATAALASDHLADIDDPAVKRITPRLVDAIDRAVRLCARTLEYLSDDTPAVDRRPVVLAELARAAGEAAAAQAAADRRPVPAWEVALPADLAVEGEPEQLLRVLVNLGQNAAQAGATRVRVSAEAAPSGAVAVRIADDGGGLSERARERLFQPFAGSGRKGGTGLGLAIARDIMRAHGGDIALERTSAEGTVFRLDFPPQGAAP